MRFIETTVWVLEGGINKVPARFFYFLSCFSAFLCFGWFFAYWRIEKVLYGAHDGHLH